MPVDMVTRKSHLTQSEVQLCSAAAIVHYELNVSALSWQCSTDSRALNDAITLQFKHAEHTVSEPPSRNRIQQLPE